MMLLILDENVDVANITNPHIVANALKLYFQHRDDAFIPKASEFMKLAKGCCS
jgi:hypothetical protein